MFRSATGSAVTPTAAVLLLLATTGIGDARPLERHFGATDSCYSRAYSKDHLKKHPQQKVAEIRFDHFPTTFGSYDENNRIAFDPKTAEVHFSVSVTFRDSQHRYTNSGLCTPKGDRYQCFIECDGGSFTLKDRSSTSILVVNPTGFAVAGCGAEEFRMLDPEPDDKVFRLDRLTDQYCIAPELPADAGN